jgi:hypothetical protein
MAAKAKTVTVHKRLSVAKRTSIGAAKLSRPKNKRAKKSHKKYRGQGRP